MTCILGLPLDEALLRLRQMGDGEYTVRMLSPAKGEREIGTVRVIQVRGRELLVSRFLDMDYLRAGAEINHVE